MRGSGGRDHDRAVLLLEGGLELVLRLDLLEPARISCESVLRLDLLDLLVTRLGVRVCLGVTQRC